MQADPCYAPVAALLAAAPPSGEPRRNFARGLLDGVAAAAEEGDEASVFGLAGELLEAALEADPTLMDDDAPAAGAAAPASGPAADAMVPAAAAVASVQPSQAVVAEPLEPTGRSKFDPMAALLEWAHAEPAPAAAPAQQRRSDAAAGLVAAAVLASPASSGAGNDKYCAVKDLLAARPPARAASSRPGAHFDPLAWLLDGWAGGRTSPAYSG